jgi:hypothetical protein
MGLCQTVCVGKVSDARDELHRELIKRGVLGRRSAEGPPTNADAESETSSQIAEGIANVITTRLAMNLSVTPLKGQTLGTVFGELVKAFLAQLLDDILPVPGRWTCKTGGAIDQFAQYAHLAQIAALMAASPELLVTLGGEYIVKPDITVSRLPLTDQQLPAGLVAPGEPLGTHTLLRATNPPALPILLASVSCKWTMRSDRAQNSRTEALNLIRTRKGRAPVIAVVTAEPMPSRLASLADGTGDFDRIYHFALNELIEATTNYANAVPKYGQEQLAHLNRMVLGRRLADISDLAFDLAV